MVYQGTLNSVWKSTDAGKNFYKVFTTTNYVRSISCDILGGNVLITVGNAVYLSPWGDTNTWNKVIFDTNFYRDADLAIGVAATSVYVSHPGTLMLILTTSKDGGPIYKSTNNGQTWIKNISVRELKIDGLFTATPVISTAYWGNIGIITSGSGSESIILISNNYCENWVQFGNLKKAFNGVATNINSDVTYFTTQGEYIYKRVNNQITPIVVLGRRNWSGICCRDSGEIVIASTYPSSLDNKSGVFISTNFGSDWRRIVPSNDNNDIYTFTKGNFVSPCCSRYGNYVYVGEYQRNIYAIAII